MPTSRVGAGAAVVEVAASPAPAARNPGPSWGYRFLVEAERILPGPVFRGALWLGTAVGVLCMGRQRRASRDYLRHALGRERVGLVEVVNHFYAFSSTLVKTLRVARGRALEIRFAPGGEADFVETSRRSGAVLYGTFHLGDGDLLGYLLGRYGRRVRMVRLRVGNSDETRWMEEQFGDSVSFIWVDTPENMLFSLRSAIEEGHSVALKCDRVEGARKTERFSFLGRERTFPFTIYWLSLLFQVPVVFSFGVGTATGGTEVYSSPTFWPEPAGSRGENLARARAHFAEVLRLVEDILRRRPQLWFNFGAWDSVAGEGGGA